MGALRVLCDAVVLKTVGDRSLVLVAPQGQPAG
jgi:hypothetical protein